MIRIAAVIAAVLAEALALYTFAEWFASGYDVDRRALPWFAFVTVALVAFTVPRLTDWLALSERASYIALWAAGYVVVYGFIRMTYAGDFALWDFNWIPDFIQSSDTATGAGSHAAISTVMLIVLWVRQSLRSVDDVDLEAMPRIVGPLFAIVTVVAVLGALTGRAGEVGRAAAAFYAVAIPALAFSQLALSGVTLGQVRAGGITATLLAGTVAATLVCVVVAGVTLAVVGPIVGPVLDRTIEIILTIILTPPAILLSWLFDLLFNERPPFVEIQNLAPRSEPEEQEVGDEGWSAKRIGAAGVRSILIFGVIVAVIAAVAYFSRLRKRVQEREEEGPVRAAVGSLGEDFGGLWRSLRPGWGRRQPAPAGTGVAQLYREVLEQAERTGHARRPSETPAEFAPVLESTFHRPVTDEITHAYEQARYAGRELDPAKLAALEREWRAAP
ncbi:MAG: DUF4129 domain-containing protein [Dehalococcoidia bacterium]